MFLQENTESLKQMKYSLKLFVNVLFVEYIILRIDYIISKYITNKGYLLTNLT